MSSEYPAPSTGHMTEITHVNNAPASTLPTRLTPRRFLVKHARAVPPYKDSPRHFPLILAAETSKDVRGCFRYIVTYGRVRKRARAAT